MMKLISTQSQQGRYRMKKKKEVVIRMDRGFNVNNLDFSM